MFLATLIMSCSAAVDPIEAAAILGADACDVQQLELRHLDDRASDLSVTLSGHRVQMRCHQHTNRSVNYKVLEDTGGGRMRQHEPSPIRTWRGRDADGYQIAFSQDDDGLRGLILAPDGERWWIEPLYQRMTKAEWGSHAVFRGSDVLRPKGWCGTTSDVSELHPQHHGDNQRSRGGILYTAELAADADFEYYQSYGSVAAVESRINAVMNGVNLQYETQCQITHAIGTIVVRSDSADPYTTDDINVRLGEVEVEWESNQSSVPRDVVHLFSGQSFAGTTIGLAYMGAVCSGQEYGVVESDCCGSLACAVDLSSHELGHNWNAPHCDCSSNTMHSSLSSCNAEFTSISISWIVDYRNSIHGCLDSNAPIGACCHGGGGCEILTELGCTAASGTWQGDETDCGDCGGGGGINGDSCSTAITVAVGATSFSSTGATDSGDPDPVDFDSECGAGWGWGGEDLWFRWSPTETGEATISTCDVDSFDTSIAVYSGDCGTLEQLACDGDGPAGGEGCQQYYSQLTVEAVSGVDLLIRVSGYSAGDTGTGTLSIEFVPDGTASGDTCSSSVLAGLGSTSFDTSDATDSGEGNPASGGCGDGWGWNNQDVWLHWNAERSGTATFSTCDVGSFDTSLAVYTGTCGNLVQEACNGDSDGSGSCQEYWSELQLDVVPETYLIRISGYGTGDTGTGTLTISLDSCMADLSNDGTVDRSDLILLLSLWGTVAPLHDIDGSGGAINVLDLLMLLEGWGAC